MERRKRGVVHISVPCRSCGVPVDLDPWAMRPEGDGLAISCWGCGASIPVRRSDVNRDELREAFAGRHRMPAAAEPTTGRRGRRRAG